jgi:hypothetical protein
MTAATTSSTVVTNTLLAGTGAAGSYNTLGQSGDCKNRSCVGTVELATTRIDDVGDVTLLFPVKGNERLTSLVIFNDDMDSHSTPTLAVDVGIYKNPSAAGTSATVVDADGYASAITTLQAANTSGVEVAFEARDINTLGQDVAADGGESSHSALRYVGITVTTAAATAVAGTLSWRATVLEA